MYLLDGLKTCGSRVVSGKNVNITLLRRVRRVLDRMRKNDVYLSVENIFALFETLLFVHDYQTSMFLVHLLRQGQHAVAFSFKNEIQCIIFI